MSKNSTQVGSTIMKPYAEAKLWPIKAYIFSATHLRTTDKLRRGSQFHGNLYSKGESTLKTLNRARIYTILSPK